MAGEPAHSSETDRPAWGIGQVARSLANRWACLIARFWRGTLEATVGIAAVVSISCGEGSVAEPKPAPVATAVAVPTPAAPAEETGPRQLGTFDVTFYYVIGEDEVGRKSARTGKPVAVAAAPANDNALVDGADPEVRTGGETELASMVPDPEPEPEKVTLYDGNTCQPIADVAKEFATELALQGTGKLNDGRVLNVWGPRCKCEQRPCYSIVTNQWGTAGTGRPLQPFRTVAVDRTVVKLGSLLYIPLLEGRTMPGKAPWGGFVHDGCVVADDTGGGIKGNQIDLFVGRKGYYMGLSGRAGSHAWARHVEVFDGSKLCERKGRRVGRKLGSI